MKENEQLARMAQEARELELPPAVRSRYLRVWHRHVILGESRSDLCRSEGIQEKEYLAALEWGHRYFRDVVPVEDMIQSFSEQARHQIRILEEHRTTIQEKAVDGFIDERAVRTHRNAAGEVTKVLVRDFKRSITQDLVTTSKAIREWLHFQACLRGLTQVRDQEQSLTQVQINLPGRFYTNPSEAEAAIESPGKNGSS